MSKGGFGKKPLGIVLAATLGLGPQGTQARDTGDVVKQSQASARQKDSGRANVSTSQAPQRMSVNVPKLQGDARANDAVLGDGQQGSRNGGKGKHRNNETAGRADSKGHRGASRNNRRGHANNFDTSDVGSEAVIHTEETTPVEEAQIGVREEYVSANERKIARKLKEKRRDFGRESGRVRKNQRGMFDTPLNEPVQSVQPVQEQPYASGKALARQEEEMWLEHSASKRNSQSGQENIMWDEHAAAKHEAARARGDFEGILRTSKKAGNEHASTPRSVTTSTENPVTAVQETVERAGASSPNVEPVVHSSSIVPAHEATEIEKPLNRRQRRAAAAAARNAGQVIDPAGGKPVFALEENDLKRVVGETNLTPEVRAANEVLGNPGALDPVPGPAGHGGGPSGGSGFGGGNASSTVRTGEENLGNAKLAFFAEAMQSIRTSFGTATPAQKFVKGAGTALGGGLLIHGVSKVFSGPKVDPKTGKSEESGWSGRIAGIAEGAVGLAAAYLALTKGGGGKSK